MLILIIQSNIIIGQESSFIYGTLINSDDQTPIPFVHITIKNKAKGTISNMDGGFRIPKNYYDTRDTLVISSIGYSSKKIPLQGLDQHLRNVIILERTAEVLDEIALGYSKNKAKNARQDFNQSTSSKKIRLKAEDIVQLALDRIPENYPFKPFSYVGYYRDYQMDQGNYVNLNEAVMHVFDAGFGIHDSVETQTRIYRHNKNMSFPEDSIAATPYDYANKRKFVSNTELGTPEAGRNEYTMLRIHDALRNYNVNTYDFVNRLDFHFIENHKLKFLSETSIDSIPLYAISIDKRWGYFTAIGKIFISKWDYKIYKMQYAVYDKTKPLTSYKPLPTDSKESVKMAKKFGKLLYEIIVEYQLYQGILYPKYISFNNSFQCIKPPGIFPESVYVIDKTNEIEVAFYLDRLGRKALKKGNYKLWYNYKLLSYKTKISNENDVKITLKKNSLIKATPYRLSDNEDGKQAKRQAEKIIDANNYELYIDPYRSLNQYREFFVQELQIGMNRPVDTLYMRKNKSVFKNQPIAPKKDLHKYWMNTPLKN